jgi:hypothetical protein
MKESSRRWTDQWRQERKEPLSELPMKLRKLVYLILQEKGSEEAELTLWHLVLLEFNLSMSRGMTRLVYVGGEAELNRMQMVTPNGGVELKRIPNLASGSHYLSVFDDNRYLDRVM